ncbi:MAG: hypothetical protein SGJ00_15220 [bacterium]|nr:hypothetical protein [bacterium]
MRYLFTLLTVLFISMNVSAQRKQPTKPATAPQAPKPKGPLPYVMKKDFDSSMIKIDKKISAVQGSLNGIKGSINNKDAQINNLSDQMTKVQEVLNSTNFKINLTSDSLSKTQLSLEEIQKENELRFNNLETQISSLSTTVNMLWITLIITLLIPIAIWYLLKKQITTLKESFNTNHNNLQLVLEEQYLNLQKQSTSLEHQIRFEGRNAQTYADQLNKALKNEISIQQNEITKTSNTLVLVSNEITELQNKVAEINNSNSKPD